MAIVSAPCDTVARMFDRANGVTKAPDLLAATSSGLDMLQWRSGTSLYVHAATRKVLELALINADAIRVGGQWQNRPNRHGLYFWAPTGHHVWHESALEAVCLMGLEFAAEVERIAAQPFRVLFRSGASAVRHDPDFFAVHRNGDQVVYDVKPTTRMTSEARAQFEETRRVCDQVGWSHRVLHEPDPTVTVNLDFLRPSRHLRCHPRPEVHEQILSVFATGREIGEGREMVNRRSPELALPYIKHLIWHRRLAVDLTARLDFGTVATSVADLEDVPCCA